jgi:hypothetical protein
MVCFRGKRATLKFKKKTATARVHASNPPGWPLAAKLQPLGVAEGVGCIAYGSAIN